MPPNHRSLWKVAGASIVGIRHEEEGLPSEDSWYAVRSTDEKGRETRAVCVSDGAGSASKAAAGAKLVSWAVTTWLGRQLNCVTSITRKQMAESLVAFARRWLRRAARKHDQELKSYACTVAAVGVRDDGEWLMVHIGDGAVVGRFDGSVRSLSLPMKGEFANETFFVTDSDAPGNLRICGSRFGEEVSPSGFAVFCDGLEYALVNRHTAEMAPALGRMIGWLDTHAEEEVSAALGKSIRGVFRQGTDDDCTIVLLSRLTEQLPAEPGNAGQGQKRHEEPQDSKEKVE